MPDISDSSTLQLHRWAAYVTDYAIEGGGSRSFEYDSIYDLIATVTQDIPE